MASRWHAISAMPGFGKSVDFGEGEAPDPFGEEVVVEDEVFHAPGDQHGDM